MALNNFANLKTSIATWLDDTTLSDVIPDFITLAEATFRAPPAAPNSGKLGGVRLGRKQQTGSLSTNGDTLGFPSDYLELDRFYLTTDPRTDIMYVSSTTLNDLFRSGTGKPKYLTIADKFEFDIAADSDYAYRLEYWPAFTLTTSNDTNPLINDYPHVYLYGALMHAQPYLKNPEAAVQFAAAYAQAAWGASESYRRGRQSRGPLEPVTDVHAR